MAELVERVRRAAVVAADSGGMEERGLGMARVVVVG
jgi:hypothetical protein